VTERRAFSVAVYARNHGKVLVILHRRLGTWLPVGGELEPARPRSRRPGASCARRAASRVSSSPWPGPAIGCRRVTLGYEEHLAGAKGVHMNFVFVAEVASTEVSPNHEFGEHRWVDRAGVEALDAPKNVREFGLLALAAQAGRRRAIRRVILR